MGGTGGGGLQGRRLTYAGSASDTVLAWPAAADAKMSQRREASSPNSERLLERIKRAANDKVSQVSAISGRTYAAAQAHLQERSARRERQHITVSDLRFDALSRLQQDQPAGAELHALWARSPTAGIDALPQLCAHLITHSSATMRWPEEEDDDEQQRAERNEDGAIACGGHGIDDTDGDLLPNLSPNKRAAAAAAIAATAYLSEPEPETEPDIDLSSPTQREEGSDGPLTLPEGWTEHWDDEHRCYFYYHEKSGQSSWERPQLVERLPLPTDAAPELGDDRHHPSKYYYCAATDEAQWTKPFGQGVSLDGLPTAGADTWTGASESAAWVTITMQETGGAQALRRFLLTKCTESFRTAMSTYWLLAAATNAEESSSNRSAEPSASPTGVLGTMVDRGSPQEGRAKVAQRLAKAVLRASAAGRSQRMSEAAAAAPDTMFPEQAAFGLRRQHAFCLQLVELAESLVEQNLGSRRGALARGLETFNQTMLPAALMAPTVHADHLLLRAHTAPPAAPKVFATNTRCPYMVFFEAVELAPREAGIPLATLRNASTMRRIHEDSRVFNMVDGKSVDRTDTSEPDSPSELQIGRLSGAHNGTLDSVVADQAGGRPPSETGNNQLDNQRDTSRIPPAGTPVEVYSVSDDRWHAGCIVGRVPPSELVEELSPRNNGTSASSDGYIRVEYNHGSRQKVVLWGDEVIRLSKSEIGSEQHDTLKTMAPGRAKLLGASDSVGSSVDADDAGDDDDNDSQSDSDDAGENVALVGARLAGWNGAMDTISTKERERQVRAASPYGKLAGWRLVSFIVKADDDLRQEQLAMQLIDEFAQEFQRQGLPLTLTTYAIIPITATAGLLETVSGAVSIDSLKKRLLENNRLYSGGSSRGAGGAADAPTLADHFEDRWGSEKRKVRKAARRRFVESLAAYSIVNYLLAVRDRHNGNILIDEQGRVVHIDFGFFLSNSPGGNANFERAPFKLTREMIDVMGGEHSLEFATFRDLVIRGFRASHRVYPKVRMLVQVALEAYGAQFPCFSGGADAVLEGLDRRFRTDLKSKREAAQFVNEELINPSIDNWRTRWYDKYQMCCLGIL